MKGDKFNKSLERLAFDLNELVENGFLLPNGVRTSVRVVQYRMDNMEKNKVMGRSVNFASSQTFSSYSYITSDDRTSARKLSQILPSNFEKMTKTSYKVGRLL